MDQTDIWSINPSTDTEQFLEATGGISGGVFPRALSLIAGSTPAVAKEGAGYRLVFTCVGDLTGVTFTINGAVVGNVDPKGPSNINFPEVVTGVDDAAVNSVYYYSRIDSIVISATVDGAKTIAIGTVGNLALPRTRVKGFYALGGAGAGSLAISRFGWSTTLGSPSTVASSVVEELLNITTPAGVTISQFLTLPGQGILTATRENDYSVVVPTGLTDYTLFCG